MAKKLTANKGFWIGVSLLAQVTALLALTALAGYVIDTSFDTAPFGLAGTVIIGSVTATIVVVREVYKLSADISSDADGKNRKR